MASTSNLTKGAQWIIDRIDSMHNDYKEALMAAVTILQFRNQCYRLHLGQREVPRYMNKRLEDAWSRYESTRRHVEWYMKQNALYASSPSHPAIIMPTPQPLMPDSTLLAPTPQEQPKASPIPLSTASLLAYDNTQPLQTSTIAPSSAASDTRQSLNLDTLGFNGQMDLSGDSNMDLSSMGISELQSLINSTNNFFPPQSTDTNTMQMDGNADFSMFGGTPNDKGMMEGVTPNTQAETDKILASLGAMGGGSGQVSTQQANADVNALLASLSGGNGNGNANTSEIQNQNQGGGDTDSNRQDFNFEYGSGGGEGEVDFSDLVGLFSNAEANQAISAQQQPSQGTLQSQPGQESIQSQQKQQLQQSPLQQMTQPQQPNQPPQPNQQQQEQQPGLQSSQTRNQGQDQSRDQQQSRHQTQWQNDQQNEQQGHQQNQQQVQQLQQQSRQQHNPPIQQSDTQDSRPAQTTQAQSTQTFSQPTQPTSEQSAQPSKQPPFQSQTTQPQSTQPGAQQSQGSQKQAPQQNQQNLGNEFNMSNFDIANFQMSNMSSMGNLGNFGASNLSNPNMGNTGGNGNKDNTLSLADLQDDGTGYDMSEINMDDFNFGDNGMPNVEGDEFESLFAEFK